MSGAILETFVFGELLKSWWHCGLQPRLYYYRDRDGGEIDFVFVQDGKGYPVEVKKSASPGPDSVRAFESLAKAGLPVSAGAVLCLTKERLPLTPKIQLLPIGIL